MPPGRLTQIIEVLESDIVVRSIHDVKATEMGKQKHKITLKNELHIFILSHKFGVIIVNIRITIVNSRVMIVHTSGFHR